MSVLHAVRTLAKELYPVVVAWRRDFHRNPELSFQEFRTHDRICEILQEAGFENIQTAGGTGVTCTLHGNAPGKVLALRGDIDALPILEENVHEFVSANTGVMHACGHDVHTASLLGTAMILKELRNEFSGTVKFIFQPGEEKLPGGASILIREGILQNPVVNHIVGQHVMPLLEVGKIGIRSGRYMASTDEIYLTIHGKGGHGAQPQMCIDPVAIMAQVLCALQQVVSRVGDPRVPSVLTFGKIEAKGATNIIPNSVYLEGTFRTMDEPWRERAHGLIRSIVENTCASYGATAELKIIKGYPVLSNDPALTDRIRKYIVAYVGEENVVDLDLWMAAEDFAWYTQEIPGCFYRLGTRNEAEGKIHGLHTPKFDIDEQALALGTGLMAWNALCWLNES